MTAAEIALVLPVLQPFGCHVIDPEQNFVSCPGQHWHTTENANADCKLFHNDDGRFRLYCHHTSCRERIDLTNRCLAALHRQRKTKQGPTRVSTPKRQEQITRIRGELFEKFAWPHDKIIADSDGAIHEPVEQHHYQIFGLFADDDIVWCGRDVWDTGSPGHAWRFRRTIEWLAERECPGQFIAPNTFNVGTYSRSAANVLRRKFLVVESDTLGCDEIGAVFRWLDLAVGLRLRAIVDTAGKSLHGWFDHPNGVVFTRLEQWLPLFGCDPAMFNPAQPCRLPGALRDGQYQKLIFIQKNPSLPTL
jgi:hypothetical protein